MGFEKRRTKGKQTILKLFAYSVGAIFKKKMKWNLLTHTAQDKRN